MKQFIFLISMLSSAAVVAQHRSDIVIPEEPLVLRSVGSFYVGGNSEKQSRSEMGGFFPEGHLTVNQMYVNFMVPASWKDSTSFVFIHGITLSGKTWESTPDGSMGWNEYVVRKGYASYVVDQAGIGRSGFNQKMYNQVRNGEIDPVKQPAMLRISDENVLVNFRFSGSNGQTLSEARFPMEAVSEFSKQSIPFTSGTLPAPNPTINNLSSLAADLKKTVLVSHSQSGAFPLEAAVLNQDGIRAIVILEPGGTASGFTEYHLNKLKHIPVLVIFGDNLEIDTDVPNHSWKSSYGGWKNFIERLNNAGGRANMLYLPAKGIRGNSHMIMMDTNNQQIADLVLAWLETQTN